MSWLLQNLLNICFPFSCKLQLTDSLVCMLTLMYILLIQFYKIKIQECYRIVLQIDSRNINFFDIPIILFSFKNFPCANGILSFDNALLLKQSSLFWAIFLAVNLFSWNQVFVPSWYLNDTSSQHLPTSLRHISLRYVTKSLFLKIRWHHNIHPFCAQ